MSNLLDRRLIALERAPAVCRTEFRAYASVAEAEVDDVPLLPGRTLVAIITGVSRAGAAP